MILKLQHVSVFYIKPSSGSKFVPNKVALVCSCFLSILAACHIVRVMGFDFLLLVLPCTGFLYLSVCYVL